MFNRPDDRSHQFSLGTLDRSDPLNHLVVTCVTEVDRE
jgi:hypothetical protein